MPRVFGTVSTPGWFVLQNQGACIFPSLYRLQQNPWNTIMKKVKFYTHSINISLNRTTSSSRKLLHLGWEMHLPTPNNKAHFCLLRPTSLWAQHRATPGRRRNHQAVGFEWCQISHSLRQTDFFLHLKNWRFFASRKRGETIVYSQSH